MKICINNSCKHELDDYQERCPYCGRLQKDYLYGAKKMEFELEHEAVHSNRERNLVVTIWLYVVIVVNVLCCLINFFPKEAWGSRFPDSAIPLSVMSGIIGIITIIAIVMLLNWKKNGFWLLFFANIVGAILSMFMSVFPFGIIGFVILYLILQLKKKGKSCWEQLS